MERVEQQPRAAKQGQVERMEAIVSTYESQLLRYATRILNNPNTAQDIVQNVFIKLFKTWNEDTAPSPRLKGWLYRVTHNEAVDHIRRESRLRVLHEKQAAEPTTCPDGRNCPMSVEDKKKLVLTQMQDLHPREQQILLLRLEEGLSYKEISAITGRTVGNVGNILHHAVQKLASSLEVSHAV